MASQQPEHTHDEMLAAWALLELQVAPVWIEIPDTRVRYFVPTFLVPMRNGM